MGTKDIIMSYVGSALGGVLGNIPDDFFSAIEEIRIRLNKPLIIKRAYREFFLNANGVTTASAQNAYKPSAADIAAVIERISDYSLYAFEEQLKMGYITVPGGHRVGITGRAVTENNEIRTIKHINGLNIRISHEVKGCADGVIRHIALPEVKNTIIISPPACGKTTMLRDIIRQLSDGTVGEGVTVGVVDERSEIGGSYKGEPQNDVGIRTDVLDGCPKVEGMINLVRAMSPDVIAVDEIGSEADALAIEAIVNAGVRVLCTVHGDGIDDLRQKKAFEGLLGKRIFERFVVLTGPAKTAGIFDSAFGRVE